MDAPANIVTLHAPAGRVPVPGSAATSLPPLPPPANLPAAATRISVERDRMVVDRLVLVDASLAAFVAERPAEERAGLVERALKIGLTALMDAGVTVNVDAVRAEFATLLRQTEDANAKAAAALDQLLRQNFADGDGRLPRTLEAFLGDRGKLRSLTDELFDETKRDSAIGRIKTLLGAYLEGDGSKLATLLDPTRLGSPLFQFRGERTGRCPAARCAMRSARRRSTATRPSVWSSSPRPTRPRGSPRSTIGRGTSTRSSTPNAPTLRSWKPPSGSPGSSPSPRFASARSRSTRRRSAQR